MKNHTKNKTKLLRILAAVIAGGFLMAQQAALLSANVFAETIETPVYGNQEDTRTLSDITYMQEMTIGICNRSAIGEEKLNVIDNRDQSMYSIKKLSDSKCWMTQNLRIVNKTITPADSDVTSNYTIPASSTSGWSTSDANNNSVYYNNNTTYGAYYTWHAATAGTSTSVSTDGQNASSSICPKGWRLPTSKAGGEFEALVNKGKSSWTTNGGVNGYWFGGTGNVAGAAFFPAGGLVSIGSLNNAGSDGFYWSSTAYNATNAYALRFDSSSVIPSSSNARFNGFSVRCINNPDIQDEPTVPEIDNPNVTVTVPPVLTMTLTESVDINVKSNAISTGNFVAKVTSNAPYTISLSAAQNGHTDLQSAENGSIPASNDVKAGESGWGIKCIGANCVNDSSTGILNTRYNALTAYGTPKIYFDSPTVATNQETSFEVGIGVNSSLASGTYATDVLVTAAQK